MLIAIVEGEKADMVMEFWKKFNIRMAIATIVEACSEWYKSVTCCVVEHSHWLDSWFWSI